MYYLLTYRSLTYAQRSARILERAGVTGTVSRLPKAASPKGCAYCVAVAGRHLDRAMDILRRAGFSPMRVITRRDDGTLEVSDDLS